MHAVYSMSVIPQFKKRKKFLHWFHISTLPFELYSKPLVWPTGSAYSGSSLPLSPYPTHSLLSCPSHNGFPSPPSKPLHTPKSFTCFFLLAGSQLQCLAHPLPLSEVFWMAWTKEFLSSMQGWLSSWHVSPSESSFIYVFIYYLLVY